MLGSIRPTAHIQATMNVWRLFSCTAAVAVLVACRIADATSIGCFATAQVRLQRQPGNFTKQTCQAACATKQLPLYALDCSTKCACSASIPPLSARAAGCRPAAGAFGCGRIIELQYIHSVGADVCRLAPHPLSHKTLHLAQPADGAMTDVDNGKLTLTMVGRDGAAVYTKDVMKYGLFEITLQAAAGPGPVTAFFLIDQLQNVTNQDEIDLEFLNQGNTFTEPNVFWTNVWTRPNSHNIREHRLYSASNIAPMLGDPSFSTTSAMHTYMLDWQPGYVRWYIEGVLVDQLAVAQGPIPSHPMYTRISLWTQTNTTYCPWFGGCLPANNTLTYKAHFKDYRRVRCYDPKAPYFDTKLAAEILAAARSPPCKHGFTANNNTYEIGVTSTRSWGYVRDQLKVMLYQVYRTYGAAHLHPIVSGPSNQTAAAQGLATAWNLTVVAPTKQCMEYKESLRTALYNAIKAFKKPPTFLGTTIFKSV